ncbi:hypothetical protein KCP74_22865 [Salmonella enterica subsp. enterica]|nr:hypothetical protein KCP74_22865 [Salmonella enterica subsp. enterica]
MEARTRGGSGTPSFHDLTGGRFPWKPSSSALCQRQRDDEAGRASIAPKQTTASADWRWSICTSPAPKRNADPLKHRIRSCGFSADEKNA